MQFALLGEAFSDFLTSGLGMLGGAILAICVLFMLSYVAKSRDQSISIGWGKFRIVIGQQPKDSPAEDKSLEDEASEGPAEPSTRFNPEFMLNAWEKLNDMDQEVRRLLGQSKMENGDAATLTFTIVQAVILQHTDQIIRMLWPDSEPVSSLKTRHPSDPHSLICYYAEHAPPPRRQRAGATNPDAIPRKGTVAGDVFENKRQRYEPDTSRNGLFAGKAHEIIEKYQIRSLVCWPVIFDGTVIAVLKLDTNRTDDIQECRALNLLLTAITVSIAMVFQIAFREQPGLLQEFSEPETS